MRAALLLLPLAAADDTVSGNPKTAYNGADNRVDDADASTTWQGYAAPTVALVKKDNLIYNSGTNASPFPASAPISLSDRLPRTAFRC